MTNSDKHAVRWSAAAQLAILLTVLTGVSILADFSAARQELATALVRYAQRVSAFPAKVVYEVFPGQVLRRVRGGLASVLDWRDSCVGVAAEHGNAGATILVVFKGRTND